MSFSNPILGEMIPLHSASAPEGWAFAKGQLLPISSNEALFALIGNAFGGHGDVFALPNIKPISSGFEYVISLAGQNPGQEGVPIENPVLGEMSVFSQVGTPRGWAPANGELLPVESDHKRCSTKCPDFCRPVF